MTTDGEVALASVVTSMTINALCVMKYMFCLHDTMTLKKVYDIIGFASYIAIYSLYGPSGEARKCLSI